MSFTPLAQCYRALLVLTRDKYLGSVTRKAHSIGSCLLFEPGITYVVMSLFVIVNEHPVRIWTLVIKAFNTVVICLLSDARCPVQSLNPPFVVLSIPAEK